MISSILSLGFVMNSTRRSLPRKSDLMVIECWWSRDDLRSSRFARVDWNHAVREIKSKLTGGSKYWSSVSLPSPLPPPSELNGFCFIVYYSLDARKVDKSGLIFFFFFGVDFDSNDDDNSKFKRWLPAKLWVKWRPILNKGYLSAIMNSSNRGNLLKSWLAGSW